MSVYFTGCTHLGHKNIAKFRHFVKDADDNTLQFLESYKAAKINKRSTVYFLGDIAFDDESLAIIASLPGRKIAVKGNHDDFVKTSAQAEVFEEIHGIIKYKGFWLTHCPIHPQELYRAKGNVHSHVHNKPIKRYGGLVLDKRYIHAGVDDLVPRYGSWFMTLDQLRART